MAERSPRQTPAEAESRPRLNSNGAWASPRRPGRILSKPTP
jgi:hypothetical protein